MRIPVAAVLVTVALGLFAPHVSTADQRSLQLDASLASSSYILGDPVLLKVRLSNNTSRTVSVIPAVLWDALRIEVVRDGVRVNPAGGAASGGGERHRGIEILPGMAEAFLEPLAFRFELAPGHHEVRVSYEVREGTKVCYFDNECVEAGWSGKLECAELSFDIEMPRTADERKLLSLVRSKERGFDEYGVGPEQFVNLQGSGADWMAYRSARAMPASLAVEPLTAYLKARPASEFAELAQIDLARVYLTIGKPDTAKSVLAGVRDTPLVRETLARVRREMAGSQARRGAPWWPPTL